MPFGDNDWLALTQEETLEPEIPICDPHHHFWDFRTERIPFQRYLLHELAADINSGHNVKSTVFVEARAMYRLDGPEEMRTVGEVEFVQGLAAASAAGLYGPSRAAAAIVGHANLNLGDAVKPVLEALQAASPNRFRGIRHSVTWDSNPAVENTSAHKAEGQMRSEKFRDGAKVLADMGLSLEGWMFFHQMPELAEFAKAVPNLTIILNHIGGLLREGPYANRDEEVMDTWRNGIAAAAQCPNIHFVFWELVSRLRLEALEVAPLSPEWKYYGDLIWMLQRQALDVFQWSTGEYFYSHCIQNAHGNPTLHGYRLIYEAMKRHELLCVTNYDGDLRMGYECLDPHPMPLLGEEDQHVRRAW